MFLHCIKWVTIMIFITTVPFLPTFIRWIPASSLAKGDNSRRLSIIYRHTWLAKMSLTEKSSVLDTILIFASESASN